MISAPYFSAFGLLTIIHSVRIIRLRLKHQVSFGDGGREDLARLIRVFANFSEYVPMGLILMIALEIVQAPFWYLHLVGFALLLGRTLHAIGLPAGNGVNRLRKSGMAFTFLSLFLSSIGLMYWTLFDPSL